MADMDLDARTREFIDEREGSVFVQYAAIIRRLRAPDGCPWDAKQTLRSLRRFIIEESFEALAAVNDLESGTGSHADVAEELGDVMLVFMLMADALRIEGGPSLENILLENAMKLVRRHPHVFGSTEVSDESEVVTNWNRIKSDIEKKPDGAAYVSNGLPPLERAREIQKKAAREGFDWPDTTPVFEKIFEETRELEDAVHNNNAKEIENELGDLLFSVVNLARKLKTDPSVALAGTNERFLARFAFIENELSVKKKTVRESSPEVLDEHWENAKRNRSSGSDV